jgi:hypothetical protein
MAVRALKKKELGFFHILFEKICEYIFCGVFHDYRVCNDRRVLESIHADQEWGQSDNDCSKALSLFSGKVRAAHPPLDPTQTAPGDLLGHTRHHCEMSPMAWRMFPREPIG